MALLGSTHWNHIPIRFFKTGREVAQCLSWASFPVFERFASAARGGAVLYHTPGPKPWSSSFAVEKDGWVDRWSTTLHAELSPYTIIAEQYRDLMDQDCTWMDPRTTVGRFLRMASMLSPDLPAIPLVMVNAVRRILRRSGT